MIGVALVPMHIDFRVDLSAVTSLVSAFYLAAAVAQPLAGRLADQFGARRIFLAGLVLACATGALAPVAPAFGYLVGARVLQALGTSAAYPAGIAMIRATAGRHERPPAGALGAIAIANALSASLGPTIGGFLVARAGWQAIFLVNIPITLVGLALALRWLPRDAPVRSGRATLVRVDLLGIGLFAVTLVGLLVFLLSLPDHTIWPLLPIALAAAILLVRHERGIAEPFLDIRTLEANRPLVGVYLAFAVVNLVFYSVFFALPIWLEEARRLDPAATGLVLLPISGLGVLATPLAARAIDRSGHRPVVVLGAVGLTAATLLLLALNSATSVAVLVGVAASFGIPYSLNNLGLQAALYQDAPGGAMGAAGGLFQTCRYVGAILSTSLIGATFGRTASDTDLRTIAIVLLVLSGLLTGATLVSVRFDRPMR
jgi:MFS family permease